MVIRDCSDKPTVVLHGIKIGDVSPAKLYPGAELWGVTRANVKFWKGELEDWSRWFDLHPLQSNGQWEGIRERRPEAWQWYRAQGADRPIYMQNTHPHVRASTEFPWRELQAEFPVLENFSTGLEPCRVFTCMIDWMIAFAIHQGFKRFILNGIGVASSLEHQILHKGIMYWMGFVRGMGRATGGEYEFLVDQPSTFAMPPKVYAFEVFKYEELRLFRRELSQAQRRANGGRRVRLTEATR